MKKGTNLILFLLFVTGFVFSQETKITGNLDSKIPVDPSITVGKLDNGLTYYIKSNPKPENRVEIRLVVNAGSLMEDDDQKGIAHFVEHMAFNGTKNFEKNEIVNYLQSIGVQFGADLNAYTSFDETVYILPIPTDDPAIVEKGFQVISDWASNVLFTDEEIDKERGVVVEEWRLGRGANQRMRDQYFPILFKNSRYAERLPIGEKEVIENVSYERVRQFYKDWYRPDLMAVIVVGDVDKNEIKGKIEEYLGGIEKPKDPRPRQSHEVPDHNETFIAITSDKEATFTQIQLLYKTDNVESVTLKDYRRDLIYQLYNGMLNERLQELTQKPEPPFLFGSTSFGSMVRTKSSYSSFAVVGENGIAAGLKTLIEENERVKKYGFTPAEFERYKLEMLDRYERAFKESDKTESGSYASEFIRAFLTNEPIPGITNEYEYVKNFLPGIKISEINGLAAQWIKDTNRVVIITGPQKEGVKMPAEGEIRTMLDEASKMEITPYEEAELATALMEQMPSPGKVVDSKFYDNVGITELSLSNGAKVVLKPTDFKNDEILMQAYSFGGNSLYSDADYQSASNASALISESGVNGFSPTDLQKLFAGKSVSASPFIGTLSEGMRGNAAPKDFETLLQLMHLYFTEPNKDQAAFTSMITKNKMLYQNLMSNPNYYFSNEVNKILTQNHPRGGGFPTVEDLEKIDFEKAFSIYKDRFADAGDFTFFFVGNFNIAEITPLLEQYLGSLPSNNRSETWKDLGVRPPNGVVNEVVRKGEDPKSQVIITFTGEKEYDKKSNYDLSSLGEMLSIKLIEILREEKGGVYGVGAFGGSSKYPVEDYTFRISFPCAPENVDDLVKAVFDEIELIKQEGVSDEDLTKIKETQRRDREEGLKQNRYWLAQLNAYYQNNTGLDTFFDREELTNTITSADLKNAAKKYLRMDNYIQVVLKPEN